MNFFLKKNKRKKFVILDIPLLLENNINNKNDILVYVQTKKSDVLTKFNYRLIIRRKNLSLLLKMTLKKKLC